MNLFHPTAYDFMVYKDYKNQFKTYLSNMENQLQDPSPRPSFYQSLYHHPSQYFFAQVHPMRVFLSYHPLTFDHTNVDQWPAAFEVYPVMPYRWGYPNQK